MKKHNILKESQKGWDSFTKFLKWSTVACAVVIAFVMVVFY
mgnify:CR=1 FL=1|jgi:hypothetical protein